MVLVSFFNECTAWAILAEESRGSGETDVKDVNRILGIVVFGTEASIKGFPQGLEERRVRPA